MALITFIFMGRPKKSEDEKSLQGSISMTPPARAVVQKFLKKYTTRNPSDIVIGALIFMEEQAVLGLDANCRPINPQTYKDAMIEFAKEGPPDKIPKRLSGKK